MNILIISTQNPFRTSGIVAYNLYNCLKDSNNRVKVLVKPYTIFESNDFACVETPFDVFKEKWRGKFERLFARFGYKNKIERTDQNFHVQDYDQTKQYFSTRYILRKADFKPDVIIYLFQQNFLTAKNLYELNQQTGAKIIWYLMDSAPLTGLCHYSWDCKGYITGCGNCPALNSAIEKDQSYKNLRFKYHYLSKTNISIISGVEYFRKRAGDSFLFKNKPIHKVLLSIDPTVFSYQDKSLAKEKWEIDSSKKVIFCGGTSITDKRKGISYLVEALNFLSTDEELEYKNIVLLVAGNSGSIFSTLPFEIKYVGFLATNEQLALAYQASDIFAVPSIEDGGPMMVNQAIMTGTPVVSFEMGVAFDLVISGETGYRAKLKDSADFARGLKSILALDDKAYKKMSSSCRELGLKLCDPKVVKKQLLEIFN